MKKNNKKKDSLKFEISFIENYAGVPNVIPQWMETYFKPVPTHALPDINEGLIEGYPIEDDF